MIETTPERQDVAALARAAGLEVPPERLATLAEDLAAARAMMAEIRAIATEATPVPFRPDWDEPTGELAR